MAIRGVGQAFDGVDVTDKPVGVLASLGIPEPNTTVGITGSKFTTIQGVGHRDNAMLVSIKDCDQLAHLSAPGSQCFVPLQDSSWDPAGEKATWWTDSEWPLKV